MNTMFSIFLVLSSFSAYAVSMPDTYLASNVRIENVTVSNQQYRGNIYFTKRACDDIWAIRYVLQIIQNGGEAGSYGVLVAPVVEKKSAESCGDSSLQEQHAFLSFDRPWFESNIQFKDFKGFDVLKTLSIQQ